MFKKCIINTCNTTKNGDGVTLHGLPEDAEIKEEWFLAILNETGQTVFSDDDVICSEHFSQDCLELRNGKTTLVPDAIPFQNLDQPPIKRIKRKEVFAQCSVFSCANILSITREKRPDLKYHEFPKNPQLAKKWKSFCNKLDNDFENSFVCSDHFTSSDYTCGPKATKVLKLKACPSIYKRENEHSQDDETPAGASVESIEEHEENDYSIDDDTANIINNVKKWEQQTFKIENAFTLNESESSQSTQKLPTRRFGSMGYDRKTSKAWQYFRDLRNNKAKCNYCEKVMSYKGGGTFNLIRHIRIVHPHALVAMCQSPFIKKVVSRTKSSFNRASILPSPSTSIVSESETSESTTPSTSSSNIYEPKVTITTTKPPQYFYKPPPTNEHDELNALVVKLFTKNYLPFNLVEAPEFKELILQLNPAYELPSRKDLSNALLTNLYNVTKEKVRSELNQADYVALTTDKWTSKTNDNFLAVTAHFFNEQAELKTFMLKCIQFSDKLTAENLCLELKKISDDWDISNKIVSATSDNANNIKAAIEMNNWNPIPCFAHTLNIIVKSALKKLQNLIMKIKQIVELFRRSPLARERLRRMQKKLGEPELKLKQYDPTRWNSTYDMFATILQIKNSVISTIAKNYPETQNIQADDLRVLNSSIEILTAFKAATEEMSSNKKLAISEVILISNALKKKCLESLSANKHSAYVERMAQCLLNELSTRFSFIEGNNIFAESTILDPRFKKHGFNNEHCYEIAYINLKAMAGRIEIKPHCDTESMPLSITSSRTAEQNYSIWDDFDNEVCNLTKNKKDPTVEGIAELDRYLKEPLLSRSRDPAKWWFSNKDVYPRLYQLFRQRLCSAATSVPSERVFTEEAQVLVERRSRLSGTKVSQIVFLNSNL